MNVYETRAAEGAALLDRAVPGWESRIDLETLDISCPRNCIIGQLLGWITGLKVLGYPVDPLCRLTPNGFAGGRHQTTAWRELITERRRATESEPVAEKSMESAGELIEV